MLTICRSNDLGHLIDLSIDNLEKGAWLNLVNPTPTELIAVSKTVDVDLDILKAALDAEERSRTEIDDNCILILTNVPIMRAKVSYDTLPLGIILTGNYTITVSLEDNPVIADFNERTAKFFRTFKKTRFLFQILYKSATLYLKYLRQISKLSDEIELRLRQSMKNQELLQILELQKGLTYFNASLRSNGAVLDKLLRLRSNNNTQHIIKMFEEDEDLLEDVIIENQQAKEMVEMHSKILSRMADTFASIISNNLNLVMKFLASITIILAIPTMISSFFGMNVDVPFGQDNGFIFVCVIAFTLTALCSLVLWKKDMF